VEVAKALGGSFKLVTLAPRTVREMTQVQLPKETQKNGDRNKSNAFVYMILWYNGKIAFYPSLTVP